MTEMNIVDGLQWSSSTVNVTLEIPVCLSNEANLMIKNIELAQKMVKNELGRFFAGLCFKIYSAA